MPGEKPEGWRDSGGPFPAEELAFEAAVARIIEHERQRSARGSYEPNSRSRALQERRRKVRQVALREPSRDCTQRQRRPACPDGPPLRIVRHDLRATVARTREDLDPRPVPQTLFAEPGAARPVGAPCRTRASEVLPVPRSNTEAHDREKALGRTERVGCLRSSLLFTPLCVGFHRNESQWRHDLTSIGHM